LIAARAAIGAASLALFALAALHVLKPDIQPSRTMISQYALGRYGWLMAVCFVAFGIASASFAVALRTSATTVSTTGLVLLLVAAIGLVMAGMFPMDPVSTPAAHRSLSGKMHGVAFLAGVPGQLVAPVLLSLSLRDDPTQMWRVLLALTALTWVSFAVMIAIMLIVGPGKAPNPDGPERFLGAPNRLFMAAYGLWLIVAAWPMVR
jgi:hypothetical membrane protein